MLKAYDTFGAAADHSALKVLVKMWLHLGFGELCLQAFSSPTAATQKYGNADKSDTCRRDAEKDSKTEEAVADEVAYA